MRCPTLLPSRSSSRPHTIGRKTARLNMTSFTPYSTDAAATATRMDERLGEHAGHNHADSQQDHRHGHQLAAFLVGQAGIIIVAAGEEAVDRHRQQIRRRQQRRDNQNHRADDVKARKAGLKRAGRQLPLADKAARRRDADQAEGSDRPAPGGNRHFLADAAQLADIGLAASDG